VRGLSGLRFSKMLAIPLKNERDGSDYLFVQLGGAVPVRWAGGGPCGCEGGNALFIQGGCGTHLEHLECGL
jgi:hypothetical protein